MANQLHAMLRKLHRKLNFFIAISYLLFLLTATLVAYEIINVDNEVFIVGILISLIATATGALFGFCHKGIVAYKNYSSFSEFVAGKKRSMDVSFITSFYTLRSQCVDILRKNGMSYEYCFQKSDRNTDASSSDESLVRTFNQKDLVARDDLESLMNVSNKIWEGYHVVPGFKVFSQISGLNNDQEMEIIPGDYISIGLHGNDLTEHYCSRNNSLFSLSSQKDAHGRLSLSIGETSFEQVTDYPVHPQTKEKLPGKARGLDFGILARHYMPFGGGEKHTCWFIGGLAGPGTVAASRYFQENYDELVEIAKEHCKKEHMPIAKANFVLVLAVERCNLNRIIPHTFFLMKHNGQPVKVTLADKSDLKYIASVVSRTNKEIQETKKLLES